MVHKPLNVRRNVFAASFNVTMIAYAFFAILLICYFINGLGVLWELVR